MQTVLAKDIVHTQLTNYMWDSRIAQIQQERRKKSSKSQIQKGGIVYASDVDRDISNLQELGAKWEADLHPDQKIYLLALRSTVLPQVLLLTKKRKEEADRITMNCQRQCSSQAVQPGRPGGARPNAKCSVVCSRIGIGRACGAPDRISSISFILS
jgi:hypothetical protein